MTDTATQLQLLGAGGFGAILGWYVYYINRYRKADVQFSDITTLVGAVGGAAVLALFPAGTSLFGAYGVGLFVGFFTYFLVLVILVFISPNFNVDFFLDGRRKKPSGNDYIPGANEAGGGQHPMYMPAQERQTVIVIPPDAIKVTATRRTAFMDGAAFVAPDTTAICQAEWPTGQMDCNVFVRAVAARAGVNLTGNANSILSQIQGSGWTSHGQDGVAASDAAASGKLVIAGLTSTELGDDHGHVVVVVAPTGPLGHGKYPYAYWGSLNDAIRTDGGKGTTINFSFDKTARDNVRYASYEI